MSLNPNHETIESPLLDRLRPACPDCEEPITLESLTCRHCGFEGEFRHGIPSLVPESGARHPSRDDASSPRLLETDVLRSLATDTEEGSIRDATATVLEGHENRTDALDAIYDVNREAWLSLLADEITGRCLDVGAGFGRRAHILAELGEPVVAVDSNLSKLRVATERDDYDNADRLLPIHTTEDRLPFGPESFDTIVADFTGSSMTEVRTRLARLSEYLDDEGTIVFTADGWPRQTGVTDLLGMDAPGSEATLSLTAGTPSAYRSMATEAGFETVSLYSLFPTASRPLFVFDIEDDRAVETVAEFVLAERGQLAGMGKPLVSLGNRMDLLRRWYPSVLAVCTNGAEEVRSSPEFGEPLLVSGRTRSVVLDIGETGVDRVWKYPNRPAHAPFTERENAVLSSLHATDEPIVETLPEGVGAASPLGEARAEDPVAGSSLEDDLSSDLRSYERVLQLGFDWLVEFQQTFRGPTVTRSPAEVRDDLRFEPTGIEPPAIDEPVTTFFTPVHGDYLTGNIHVADDEVTTVIDWEYGALEASPIIDAGFLVLETAMQVFGGIEDGFRTAFCEDNEYARLTRSTIRSYCQALGIPTRTFELYLPSVYLHRLELDRQFDAVSTYTELVEIRSRAVEFVFDNLDDVSLE
ncbi:class I SAM-dependent methyltransferase [Natronolimnohabitans sp. A-GB9]|uniref:class I SAM-dependent methyltransferase n=1 Tax=Natronolimnohabitans sp. A-GB9 TaxID=3069757 RepID=UPI0027B47D30|nr:class I SAM-dependent methyltransferase [Natronolimnohabitans sp. A-GB9]MDQ2052047.1 class I SAM-dependent methyltransferase [Natronolimnohabitans sp. A-GB9]